MTLTISRPNAYDADLVKRIGIAFTTRPRIAFHEIAVAVRDGIVVLRGTVPTIYDHRLIVSLTRHVAGVRKVDDELVVDEVPRADRSTPSAASEPARGAKNRERKRSWERLRQLPLVPKSLDEIVQEKAQG